MLKNLLKNLRFKNKIIIMPLMALTALFLILFLSWFLASRNKTQLTRIEKGYYPTLEINRDLTEMLNSIQRRMQDAVQSEEESILEETDALRDSFLRLIQDGRKNISVNVKELANIEKAFQEYYPLAREISQQMIAGFLGESLTDKIGIMTVKYNAIKRTLDRSTKQKKEGIIDAFIKTRGNQNTSMVVSLVISLICIILLGGSSILLIELTTKPLNKIVNVANKLAEGNTDVEITVESKDEIGDLAKVFSTLIDTNKTLANAATAIGRGNYDVPIKARSDKDTLGNALSLMRNNLIENSKEIEERNWIKTGQTELNTKMSGTQDPTKLAQNIISYLANYLNAQIGAVYLSDETGGNNLLKLVGSFAYKKRKNISNAFKLGEGIIGQSALEKQPILLTNVPEDYIKIHSGLGETPPNNIIVIPLLYEGDVKGVIELGSLHEYSDIQMEFFNEITENIAIAFASAQSRLQLQELLEKTQQQSEELQSQQEELRQMNEELEEQTKTLKESEARLQTQQEELQQTNEELKEKTEAIERQSEDIRKKNIDLEFTKNQLEEKAKDLELTSKYKSEFLSNMSHELRTPLNSLLILSKLLSENKEGNLTEKQLEYINIVHSSGSDLLDLINEILDLSKVESGKVELRTEKVTIIVFAANIKRNFEHMAKKKGLTFDIELAEGLPDHIYTDKQRLEQIIKNFLSNAIKFTEKGRVSVSIHRPGNEINLSKSGLVPHKTIAIAVTDTGKGIARDKQKLIFEAFQQEDGTTNRKYGGTGLGLSISRELAKLLGGEIQLESTVGIGSSFTLFLPETLSPKHKEQPPLSSAVLTEEIEPNRNLKVEDPDPKKEPPDVKVIPDDRKDISPKDRSILIIEDDSKFIKILVDLAHKKGFKCLVARDGEKGLKDASRYKPSAIILDVGLEGIDGWTVMERLKDNPDTRHIPVHFITASERTIDAMKMGAIGFLTKPVSSDKLNEAFKKIKENISKNIKKLLVVEDDEAQRKSIIELLGNGDVEVTSIETGQEAYDHLKSNHYDCMVLDLGLKDISGFELLDKIRSDNSISHIPIIIYTGKELSKEERLQLQKHAETIIIKGVKSPERLLDETTLFLHRIEKNMPEDKQKILRLLHDKEMIFKNKKILVVDDDMRNVFALTSILEEKEIQVLVAQNGRESLDVLKDNPNIDLILMDIMMPGMDGYEAIREIRKQKRFRNLPIIALTAKAMKGDRSKCVEVGASDYMSKPVNTDKLFSLMRVWLYK